MTQLIIEQLDWQKMEGLIPAIIQHTDTLQVLMLGYVSQQALEQSSTEGKVTFYSRSKKRLWTKGEQSGNFLMIDKFVTDCDNDALLFLVKPQGHTCHLDRTSCFDTDGVTNLSALGKLINIIADRQQNPTANSYTKQLLDSHIKRVAQKVAEEGAEVAIAGICEDDQHLCAEVADLFYHVMVLLHHRDVNLSQVMQVLLDRSKPV